MLNIFCFFTKYAASWAAGSLCIIIWYNQWVNRKQIGYFWVHGYLYRMHSDIAEHDYAFDFSVPMACAGTADGVVDPVNMGVAINQ